MRITYTRFFCRSHILESNGLDIYLGIIVGPEEESSTVESTPKEHLKVIKEASAGLLALLEDNQTKLEVRPIISERLCDYIHIYKSSF